MTMTERAIQEMKLAGLYDEDSDYDGMVGKSVEELLMVFGNQGHSGFSASMVANIFHKVALGGNLTPIKGTPDEWVHVAEHDGKPLYQNVRAGHIFAYGPNGEEAYDIDGIVFVDESGCNWTNSKLSSVQVTFPYNPKTIYIKEGTPEAEQYKEVFER